MKTTEFNSNISSKQLNEAMFKKFGVHVNFENYTREQLEDARNKIRTKLSQTESSAGFNDLLANENYQRDKHMLNLLNTRIKEMLGERKLTKAEKAKKEKVVKKDLKPKKKEFTKRYGKDKGEQVMYAVATNIAKGKKMKKKTTEAKKAKPDYLDFDGDGNKKEPMKKALKDKKKKVPSKKVDEMYFYDTPKKGGQSNPSRDVLDRRPKGGVAKYGKEYKARNKDQYPLGGPKGKIPEGKEKCCCDSKGKSKCPVHGAKKGLDLKTLRDAAKKATPVNKKKAMKENAIRAAHYKIIIESMKHLIMENEEEKAKTISNAADMVDEFTQFMTRVGKLQTTNLISLHDDIRKNIGQAEADGFKNSIEGALKETLDVLTKNRDLLSRAVATLAGGELPPEPMGTMPGEEVPPSDADTMNLSGEEMPPEDEFGASDAAAGGAETAGRGMRESREIKLNKIISENSLMSKLAK